MAWSCDLYISKCVLVRKLRQSCAGAWSLVTVTWRHMTVVLHEAGRGTILIVYFSWISVKVWGVRTVIEMGFCCKWDLVLWKNTVMWTFTSQNILLRCKPFLVWKEGSLVTCSALWKTVSSYMRSLPVFEPRMNVLPLERGYLVLPTADWW
jgi:hypothetical protein